ncbi:MAG: T9SS type A sorting domain-containing protein [Bacteroidetes bacterium]|nr:T9SS type A sorting domain-containing protein [Bacteroidota bacterium]
MSAFGNALKNPWVGGFNAPVFSEIDLDGDGIRDLFVFDKEGNRISTYINNGAPNTVDYVFAPEYKKKFPAGLHDWVLLKDFNCDGKEDIFTYSYGSGITVYRNDYSVQDGLKFTLLYNLIYSVYPVGYYNLYVSPVNLPALVDVDYDGDLDILTFALNGSWVEFHKNLGKELFNKCDTLVYTMEPDCFGNFGLSANSNTAILNTTCRINGLYSPFPDSSAQTALHSGSCMISFDIDGDGDNDLMNGDFLGNNLLQLTNGGSATAANIVSQDSLFPVYNTPVDIFTFPAPYYLDVNNDSQKDLIVAPCLSGPTENYNNILLYKNTTNNITNVFNYQQNRFLTEDVIEVGAGANVTFVDIDADGLKDIIIGNFGYYSSILPFESGLSYYRNTGSATAPAFDLQTIDFGNFFSLSVTEIKPTFGDVDSDNDLDLLLGQTDGTIIYYSNTAGPGNYPIYSLVQPQLTNNFGIPIDVGQSSTPQLIDVNRDGKLDLIIGEKSSNISYYENTGTPFSPVFTLLNPNFGGVNVNSYPFLYGYSNPILFDSAGTYQLFVGSTSGYIYYYNNIDNNLNGNFTLVDSMYQNINEPLRSTVDVADLNNDGVLEILVGNFSGGVTLYKWEQSTGIQDGKTPPVVDFSVYPNPTSGDLFVKFKSSAIIERNIAVIDITGRLVEQRNSSSGVIIFDTKNYGKGMYQLRIIEGSNVKIGKFIVR